MKLVKVVSILLDTDDILILVHKEKIEECKNKIWIDIILDWMIIKSPSLNPFKVLVLLWSLGGNLSLILGPTPHSPVPLTLAHILWPNPRTTHTNTHTQVLTKTSHIHSKTFSSAAFFWQHNQIELYLNLSQTTGLRYRVYLRLWKAKLCKVV